MTDVAGIKQKRYPRKTWRDGVRQTMNDFVLPYEYAKDQKEGSQ